MNGLPHGWTRTPFRTCDPSWEWTDGNACNCPRRRRKNALRKRVKTTWEAGCRKLARSHIPLAYLSLPFPRSGQGVGEAGIRQGAFSRNIGEFFFRPVDQLDTKPRFILQGYTTVLRPVRLLQQTVPEVVGVHKKLTHMAARDAGDQVGIAHGTQTGSPVVRHDLNAVKRRGPG